MLADRISKPGRSSLGQTTTIVAGRRPVAELLKNREQEIERLLVAERLVKSQKGQAIQRLLSDANRRQIPVESVPTENLDQLSPSPHQGVVAFVWTSAYLSVETLLSQAGPTPLLVMLDSVQDPHNLGAIIRTAEASNADGVIIPERRSASLTTGAFKSSAGGVAHLPVARVKNLVRTIEWLQSKHIWVVGADLTGDQLYTQADFRQPICIVLGGEGDGLRRLTRERCDFCVRIPMLGKIESLNVSVAAGVLLYEAVRQRMTDV